MKNKLLLIAMGFALTTQMIMAQVPSYVPTNGLVGYWPFNGNANDESGNGNNGVVNGAALTSDRFGNANSAYSFDGVDSRIDIENSFFDNGWSNYTINYWLNVNQINPMDGNTILNTVPHGGFALGYSYFASNSFYHFKSSSTSGSTWDIFSHEYSNTNNINSNTFYQFTLVKQGLIYKYFVNGILDKIMNTTIAPISMLFALKIGAIDGNTEFFNGKIDDIAIWNRALSEQEISNLYNSVSTNECLTMVINTGVLSTTPVTYTSSVTIYPNPANDQITIDCGNLTNVVGWNIKITNMLGQEVFNQPMNTQQYVVPLNSWTGQGMYFVKIINAQNEVVNIKKIILQ